MQAIPGPRTAAQRPVSRARTVNVLARRSRPSSGDSGGLILPGGGGGAPQQQPGGGRPGSPGLIIPGQTGPGGRPGGGRIMLPNERLAGGPGGGGGLGGALGGGLGGPAPGGAAGAPGAPAGDRPLPNRFRPPPGFMNDSPSIDAATATMGDDEMISKLRARAGHWHQLAKLIPALNAKGYDSNTLDELTGITPVEQNLWVVAGTVYDSLAAAGAEAATPGLLGHFESGGESLLYHFRFLPVHRRIDAAKYIAANDLTPTDCEVLARAMKEWDRRPGERQGYANTAGDCLAFKYMRDAIECRFAEDAYAKIEQGTAVAETDGARARLEAARKEIEEAEAAKSGGAGGLSSNAMLTLLRLSPDELGVRPVPQVSDFGTATAAELAAAPEAHQEGAFGTFTISGADGGAKHRWVALPQWKALSLARRPAALFIADCSRSAALTAASQCKTDDDRRRMQGPGLLVVDAGADAGGELDPKAYYLAASEGGALQLVDGAALAARGGGGAAPAAAVLFLARPPARESAAATTSELLQV